LELPADQWNQAEDEDWILYANRVATQQLQVGRPFDALSVLNQRRRIWQVEALRPLISFVIDAVFHDYANRYEKIRETQESGSERTRRMNSLVSEIGTAAIDLPVEASYVRKLFDEQRPGTRLVALSIVEKKPIPQLIDIAIDAIGNALSPFEQYHALLVAQMALKRASKQLKIKLSQALVLPRGIPIHESDPSRANLKRTLLGLLKDERESESEPWDYPLVEVNASGPVIYRDDPNERHGPFVLTRGQHQLALPPRFRMGIYPITNEQYVEFINDGGYLEDEFWEGVSRSGFVTRDGKTRGPSTWPSSTRYPTRQENHPVAGISYAEACAFIKWLNRRHPDPEWSWCLPSEDMWEFSARSSQGLHYPWGSAFLRDHCNSAESGIKGTSEIARYPEGNSFYGCSDMAGNVWEFVENLVPRDAMWTSSDLAGSEYYVLRGGSFRNNEYEVKSYLRLVNVSFDHRPEDFGLRCAQIGRSHAKRDALAAVQS
jgi:formylglycine-generating enzyme required for sulfatase activity